LKTDLAYSSQEKVTELQEKRIGLQLKLLTLRIVVQAPLKSLDLIRPTCRVVRQAAPKAIKSTLELLLIVSFVLKVKEVGKESIRQRRLA